MHSICKLKTWIGIQVKIEGNSKRSLRDIKYDKSLYKKLNSHFCS